MKKLYSLLVFILFYVMTAKATLLTGTLNRPDGTGFTGTLYLSIAQQVGISSLGSCGGPILVVPTDQVAIPVVSGVIQGTWNIYGSDCTLPAGMPYNAVLKDPQGNTLFSTMWLITGTTQSVGTVYQGPTPIPPTAVTIVPGVGLPGSLACSAQTLYLQTDASSGAYLFPCINGLFVAQGGVGSGGSGGTIGGGVAGSSPNVVLFVDGSGNLAQDASNFTYNSSTHVLTVVQPIVGSVTGNAATSTSLGTTPSLCTGSQVAYGISVLGNAQCKTLTYSDIGGSIPTGLVLSVFGRGGTVVATTGDYSFAQISGTISPGQLPGGGVFPYPAAGVPLSTGSAWGSSYGTVGTGANLVLADSPTLIAPTLGDALATTINGTPIPSTATLMTTASVLLAAQMPTFTGDIQNTLLAMTVKGIGGIPLCTSITWSAAQTFSYTTSSTPNPCLTTAAATSGLVLKTNSISNTLQNTQNLVNGANMQLTSDNLGNVIVACPACANSIPLGILQNIDWPPTTTNAMNDEFTTAFNASTVWNVVNQSTNIVQDANSLLSIQAAAHSGNSFVGVYQLTPATPFAVAAKIRLTGVNASAYYGGLAFRDSGTGKVVSVSIGNGNTISVDHWASPTASAINVYSQALDKQPNYYQVEDDGTNFMFFTSDDGVAYLKVYQESRTAYLASPGQVGYMAGSANATYGMSLGSDWFRRTL